MYKTLLALLVIAAAAPGAARDRRDLPTATPAGKPVSCIPLRSIRQSHVRNDNVIDFEMNGRKVYRNTLPNSCPGLGFEESFAYQTSLSQLCSTDIITVLQSPGARRGASCGLGQFQPVTLAKKARR
ncbi:hypothetical protein [Sphingomonas sp. PB4P5]|uniref:hypothetical protein n=1 Tax=Parasphingomonas puruogangriensis TaxID=3096155 RepID=UPI002FC68245